MKKRLIITAIFALVIVAIIGGVLLSGVLGSPTTTPATPATTTPDVYYKNCAEARAAGVTPLHKGEPGYRPGLDRDGDGIACE